MVFGPVGISSVMWDASEELELELWALGVWILDARDWDNSAAGDGLGIGNVRIRKCGGSGLGWD